MPHYSNLKDALTVLDDKLRSLSTLTKANAFLVDIMRKDRALLEELEAPAARAMLMDRACATFGEEAGETADPDVLDVLATALTEGQTAEIIPFPTERRH
ncbi:hypothetical protein [Phaeobacter gallaeciensis]|uniref:Uncharacterized protein n=1 Tax=Phaeobacter gallaeciensis TaxID=60890 RepID=A0AAC9Z9A6_9RHOB|nr:hypothetical protein [Phaeobacter gallaeciensis]AHD10348.1 hypothetical protein Gal_02610 [Phaeobacter gallaeciensis DSM 26640]ATE93612.1 hypothetical protein PhaeoP11_02600 [Phaeobacter gallaeciensis]ATE96567.1 hypothetical protein PhaeoP73_01247 [Phaeobacter gallaeciensis]ATF02276.1 hypothetical protein PhaeoP75_02649 [Phaeobacter gallaeciensis]ATF06656.1 hypothetical protein PhaeoP63_02598 [Phaeobacter gallaeciensis]